FAIANAGFCVTLWATNNPAAATSIPTNTQNPTSPTTIQTIGLIFFDCATGLAGTFAGWLAKGTACCIPPTGFPHCAQKLLLTFAPQFVQNAIGPPLVAGASTTSGPVFPQ